MSDYTRVVAYTRVSSVEQSQGYSLEAQERCVREYAERNHLRIAELFSESHSAYKPGRPRFAAMLQYLAQNPDVRAILAYKLDRLTRNMPDFATISSLPNVRIISATEALPPGATGELLSVVTAGISRFFSAQIGERASLGMRTKCRNGLYPSLAPLGYLNTKEPPCIVPDPLRADMVKELFEHHARSGASLSGLVDWAAKRGLTTRSGGRLRLSVLHQLIQNPIYYGTFRWGGEVYEGKHEPLITRSLFDRCQERLKARTHSVTKRSFPYRGLVVCGYCGCQLTAAYAKKKYVYYRCTEGRGECRHEYIREDRLGLRLAEVVDRIHLSSANVSELMQLLGDRREDRVNHRETRLAKLAAQRATIEERRAKAYTDKADGIIGQDRWLTMDKRWAAEDLVVKSEIELLGAQRDPSPDDVKATLELLNRAPDLYRRQSDAERARLLRVLVWNLTLTDESVSPVYRKPFDLVAEGVSSGVWYA
jgi:DNA invertase Pin-like site-specific DNA recombinase